MFRIGWVHLFFNSTSSNFGSLIRINLCFLAYGELIAISNKYSESGGQPMNSYLTPQSVHVVGQARQVQLILKQWVREWGPDAKLVDMLAGRK